jgi:hypothetical protein
VEISRSRSKNHNNRESSQSRSITIIRSIIRNIRNIRQIRMLRKDLQILLERRRGREIRIRTRVIRIERGCVNSLIKES